MSERGDVISADDPFAASIADLDSGQYLGDGQVLEGLVRMMISEAFEADGGDELEVLVETFARAVLGMNPKMTVVPGWNRAGVIDAFVTEWTGIKGESGLEVLKRYGLWLIDQAADVASYAAQPDVVREDWVWQLDAIVVDAVRLLQGVSPVTDLGVEVPIEPETSGDVLRRVTEGWVTIGQDEDGEGGHPVLIDGDGKMKSGKFAGETMKGAFGKGGKADQVAATKPKGGESRPAPAVPASVDHLHTSLANPAAMTKADVKSAFASVDREKHKQLADEISAARPDLAAEAAYRWQTSGPKKKAAPVSTANDEAFEVNADTAKARVADGRSAFPKVAAPYSKANLGISQNEKFNLPIENVPISQLVTSQKDVNPSKVDYFAKGGEDDPNAMQPYVIKVGDKYHIEDGNHRLTADVLSGKTSIPIRVMTLDAEGKWDGKLASKPAPVAKDAKNAVQDYTTDKFQRVNGALRGFQPMDKDTKSIVDGVDAYLASAPKRVGATSRSFTIPVGQEDKFASMLAPGAIYSDSAYLSTRKKPNIEERASFAGKVTGDRRVVMKVNGTSGVDISGESLNSGEGEVLYPRGTKFKVDKVINTSNGGILVEMSEVPNA